MPPPWLCFSPSGGPLLWLSGVPPQTADLANSTASEDDKIKAMMSQSSQEYDPSKYVKSRSMTGPLPPNYTCFRCGKSGHWIKNCPTNNIEVKRSTGIPRSFMVTVDGPDHKGALLTSTGEFAVPLIDHQAYKEVKKEKPPFVREPTPPPVQEPQLPDELLCMICHDLLQDAVLIPCCGNSFCDDCVRQALLDSEHHECPVCHETDISPNNLIPNRFLRTAVLNFKNETGYTRVRRGQLSAPAPAAATPAASPSPLRDAAASEGAGGAATPPPLPAADDKDAGRSPAKRPKANEAEGKPAEGAGDGASSSEAAAVASALEDVSQSPVVDGAENPPGTPLADEPPDEPSGPSLDEILTMSPQHRSHDDEGSPPRHPHHLGPGGGSPASLGNGEDSVCAIATITTRVPAYAGPIIPGRGGRDAPLEPPRGPPGRGSLHRSSRHGDYGHHRSRHGDYGPGGLRSGGGDYRSGGYPPYSGAATLAAGGGGSYPPPPLHMPPPPQGHHLAAPPSMPPPPFPGQAPPPGMPGMSVVPPHFPMQSGAGYIPPAKPFGPADEYHGRRSRSRRSGGGGGDPLEEFEKHLRDLHRNRHRERRDRRGRSKSRSKSRSPRSRSSSYSRSRSKSRGGRSSAASRSYSPRSRYSGSSRSYSPRSRSYSPRSRSRSYSRSRSPPPRHHRSRSPRSPPAGGGGGDGRRRPTSKSPPHGRRSRSGSYRSRSRSPGRSRRGRHHYHGSTSSHGSGRPYHRSRTPRSPRSYHHHPLPPLPPHHLGPPPHSYRGRSPSFRAHRRGFFGGPPGGFPHHPGYPHHPSEHMVPPVEFDARSGHYYAPHHHRDGMNPAYRGYPPGYPPGPPPPHRSDGRDRYDGPPPPGMPPRGYHGDPGSRRERPRGEYLPAAPDMGSEPPSKSSREGRSREHRRHAGDAITTPLVVSREHGTEGKGEVKPRKRSTDKEDKLLKHKRHHKLRESKKDAREAAPPEAKVAKHPKAPAAPSEAAPRTPETKALEVVSPKEAAKSVEGEEQQLQEAAAAAKERKHKHKKKLKQEEALKKMAAKMAARTSDESSQPQPSGGDDEPLKRKKKKKKLREARLLKQTLLLTPPDLSREQSMVAFLTAELEQGVPDAARLSKIEEQLELAKRKLLGDDREEALQGTTPEEPKNEATTPGDVQSIWDDVEINPEPKDSAEPQVEENVLQVEVPELSKWEREELEGEESPPHDAQPPEEPKEAKPVVSSEVLQRAENVLLHKPRKKAMATAAALALGQLSSSEQKKPSSKVTPPHSAQGPSADEPSESTVREVREGWKDPSVPPRLRDRLDGTLQVTITSSSEKERRSVTASDKEQRGSSSESAQQTKRVKLDRSKFVEKQSRARDSEVGDGGKSSTRSTSGGRRSDERSGGRSDDRSTGDHERRLPPEDVRLRLDERKALEAHRRVVPPGGSSRGDRDFSRSSRLGRVRDRELSHRSSTRDGHLVDERRRYKDERYYAAVHEERARRAYEEARRMQMEAELSHGGRRKAPDDHRSRSHTSEESERVRVHERRADPSRVPGKGEGHGDPEDHHRSRRADWPSHQASQPSQQRSRSSDKGDKPHRHHRGKSPHFAVPSAASSASSTAAHGGESQAAPPVASKSSERRVPAESSLRHRKESTQDESRFEPDYDELIEDEPGPGIATEASQPGRGTVKRRAVTAITEVSAGKKSRLADEAASSAAAGAASPVPAVATDGAQPVGTPAVAAVASADDKSSSSSSDSSDDEATSHKKHKKKHKKHKKHKHKHKKKKKSKKAEKSD